MIPAPPIGPYKCCRFDSQTGSQCRGEMRAWEITQTVDGPRWLYFCDMCKRSAMNDIAPRRHTVWDVLAAIAFAWLDRQFEGTIAPVSQSSSRQVDNDGVVLTPVAHQNIFAAYASAWA